MPRPPPSSTLFPYTTLFRSQFLLMLMAFGEPFSLLLLAGVFFTYLVSTLIPSFVFGKLLIRETSGLVILSFGVENEMVIIVSSLLRWLINLGIPSLIGMFFIFRKKFLLNACAISFIFIAVFAFVFR